MKSQGSSVRVPTESLHGAPSRSRRIGALGCFQGGRPRQDQRRRERAGQPGQTRARREQSRKSSAVRRERKAKAQLEQAGSQAFRREHGKVKTPPHSRPRIYPERAPLARVVLAASSFGYDPRDDAEVVRIARLIADEPEVASLDHDDLRTRLASIRNGSTFTF